MTSQPKPPRIKFCGFTRQQDLAEAIDLQVDAIGLNFYPKSKRYVEPLIAKRLSSLGVPSGCNPIAWPRVRRMAHGVREFYLLARIADS